MIQLSILLLTRLRIKILSLQLGQQHLGLSHRTQLQLSIMILTMLKFLTRILDTTISLLNQDSLDSIRTKKHILLQRNSRDLSLLDKNTNHSSRISKKEEAKDVSRSLLAILLLQMRVLEQYTAHLALVRTIIKLVFKTTLLSLMILLYLSMKTDSSQVKCLTSKEYKSKMLIN